MAGRLILSIGAGVLAANGCAGPRSAPRAKPPVRATDRDLEARCDRRDSAACIEVGWRFITGDDVEVDVARGRRAFAKGCAANDREACILDALQRAIALADRRPEEPTANAEAVRNVLADGCRAANARACRGLAIMLHEGLGGAPDLAGAEHAANQGCTLGDGTGCGLLALIILNQHNDTDRARDTAQRGCKLAAGIACFIASRLVADDKETARLLDRGCQLGDAGSCEFAGKAARDAPDGDRRASELFERACQLGTLTSCVSFGELVLARDRRVAADDARATHALTRACDANLAAGCAHLGVAHQLGRGVATDARRAIELFTKACDDPADRETVGCVGLAAAYLSGTGVTKDPARAALFAERACARRDGVGCALLAELYTKGLGVAQDLERAGRLLHDACELDHVPSCTNPNRKPY